MRPPRPLPLRPAPERLEGRCLPAAIFHEFTIPTINSQPAGITAGSDGNLYFTESNSGQIGRVTPTGEFAEFALPSASSRPLGITNDGGLLVFTENAANKVAEMSTFGTLSEFSIPTANSGPSAITHLTLGGDAFTENKAGKIGEFNANTGSFFEFALPDPNSQPAGIANGPNEDIWFTEQAVNRIGRIDQGKLTEFVLPFNGTNNAPLGITLGPDGNLWFTEPGTNQIGRITEAGVITQFPIPVPNASPHDIVTGPDNALYFTEANAGRIGRITTDGTYSDFVIPTSNSFPQGLVVGPDHNLWFAEFNGNRIGQLVMPHFIVTGSGPGGPPTVNVFDSLTGALLESFSAYDSRCQGGVRVALGDLDGDGDADIVTAPGPAGGPDVRVFDPFTGKIIAEFMAYSTAFKGGVNVAVGDVNGNGSADIVTAPDAGGGPEVKVFEGVSLPAPGTTTAPDVLADFNAYASGFTGGVHVAVGNVEGAGPADVITGPGSGGGPEVKVFRINFGNTAPTVVADFAAYDSKFKGGVYVAAGDFNNDGFADVVTGAGPGGGPHVKVFDGKSLTQGGLNTLQSFMAYNPAFTGGVRVATADVNGDGVADLITGAGPGGGPHVQVFDGTNLNVLDSFYAYGSNFAAGVFVGGL